MFFILRYLDSRYILSRNSRYPLLSIEFVYFLGSDVNRQDEDGRTPLMLACASDLDGRSVEYLIKHKADTSLQDKKVYPKKPHGNFFYIKTPK